MAVAMDVVRKSLQDLEDEITCAVCYQHYTEPKVLPCCHYYCKQCVFNVAIRATPLQPFHCPECRKSFPLTQEDVELLPTAFFLNRMKDLYSVLERARSKAGIQCEMCTESGRALGYCQQCCLYSCQKCTRFHALIKSFKDHEVVSFQEPLGDTCKRGEASTESPCKVCPEHDELLKLYCSDCDSIICRDCTLTDHRDHSFDFFSKVTKKMKATLQEDMRPLREPAESCKLAVEGIQSTRSELETQVSSVINNIEHSFEELHTIVEGRKEQLLNEVGKVMADKMSALLVQEKNVSSVAAEIRSLEDFVSSTCQGSDRNVVLAFTSARKRIQASVDHHSQSEQTVSIDPTEVADIAVKIKCAKYIKYRCQNKAKLIQLPLHLTNCKVTGEGLSRAEVNKQSCVSLKMRVSTNSPDVFVFAILAPLAGGKSVDCVTTWSKKGECSMCYTPVVRGRHKLIIMADGCNILGSPFPVSVTFPPDKLQKPVHVWRNVSQPTGLAVESSGNVLVTEFKGDVLRLSKDGKKNVVYKRSEYKFQELHNVAVDDHDVAYFTDQSSSVIFRSNGSGIEACNSKQADDIGYLGVAVGGDRILTCERGNRACVTVFDKDLGYLAHLPSDEKINGSFSGISVGPSGDIYAVDNKNGCISVFDALGEHLRSFGSDQDNKTKLGEPWGVCVTSDYVYVTDRIKHCVSVFTLEGTHVSSFGQQGSARGNFKCPHGICVDNDGFVYVSDGRNNRVQKF